MQQARSAKGDHVYVCIQCDDTWVDNVFENLMSFSWLDFWQCETDVSLDCVHIKSVTEHAITPKSQSSVFV